MSVTARAEIGSALQQKFRRLPNGLQRTIVARDEQWVSKVRPVAPVADGAAKAWAVARLQAAPLEAPKHERNLRIVDVFSGCGGFATGFAEAASAIGARATFAAAIDLDEMALATHAHNLKTRLKLRRDAASLVDFAVSSSDGARRFAYAPTILNKDLAALAGHCDVVIGGPPCQGHSNLNNHTRRSDERNLLYLVVPAIAIALDAPLVIIENVTTVLRDQRNVVAQASQILGNAGYRVTEVILRAEEFGVPQLRRRHFLIASRRAEVDLTGAASLRMPMITAWDAISDLADIEITADYDRPTALTPTNQARVDFLFDRDLHDLPNDQRPDCHKDGHTYPSVYGRMKRDEPCLTITGGFLQPGQGRFIHPTRPRALTPHEGARLQGFSDGFKFVGPNDLKLSRKDYAQMIGDSVPPPLAYVAAMLGLMSL
ncbi:MAG: DNA cytosine methyltransferase [Hyphomonadaceae bacterium]